GGVPLPANGSNSNGDNTTYSTNGPRRSMRQRARPVRFLDFAMINTGDVDAYEAVTSASGHENDTRIGQAGAEQIFGTAELDAVRDSDAAYHRRRRRGD
ncbi:unnamed protein product, partial [Laminaria digitata]